jgi:hypothetical protein
MEQESTETLIPVVMFSKSKNLPDSYPQIIKSFGSVIKDARIEEASSLDVFFELVKAGNPAVLIYHVADREELMSILNFLPTVRQSLKERRAVVSIFAKITSEKVEETLMKSGCTEILRYDLSSKAFLYKLKRYLLFLKMDRAGEVEEVEVKGQAKVKEGAPDSFLEKKHEEKKPVGRHGQTVLIEPLKSKFDYWLIRKVPYVHRYKGQWMVELIGPSPAAGKWRLSTRHKALFPAEDQVWEWGLRDNPGKFGETFNAAPAAWVFTGKKPEYNWVLNRWAFLSTSPGMYLVENEKIIETRFFEDDQGLLEIAKNSPQSDGVFEGLRATFDQDYFLELEKLDTNGIIGTIEAPPNVPWADKQDAKKIPPAAWKNHDLTKDEGPDWNDQQGPEDEEINKGPNPDGESTELDIPLGADAMRDCGVRAMMNGEDVELMSYSETQPIITIGTSIKIKIKDEIDIQIESDNMKYEDLNFTLKGIVSGVEVDDQERIIATVVLKTESHKKIGKIKFAVEKRQAEIFEFFKRAKGTG